MNKNKSTDEIVHSTNEEEIGRFFSFTNRKIQEEVKRGNGAELSRTYSAVIQSALYGQNAPSVHFLDVLQQQWQYGDIYALSLLRIWEAGITKFYMESSLLCDALVALSDGKVLKNVTSPSLFSDFVVNSFQSSHPANALALGSVIYLMLNCNLEYPKLYDEVYGMLQLNIFTMPYRSTFFNYLDMIMRSTHLPIYMIAAYIKRLSRLLLFAPADCCLTILGLIRNWIVRHPGSQILLSPKNITAINDDPFDYDTCSPEKSNALKSSLWEVETMKNHYLDKVVKTASFVDFPLPSVEVPFRLESDFDRIFRDEKKVAVKEYTVEAFEQNDVTLHVGNSALTFVSIKNE